MGRLFHDQDALYIQYGKTASPGLDRNIETTDGKSSALPGNDTDIEDAVWRNVDGGWAKFRYRLVVEHDATKRCRRGKFGRIKYAWSIVSIGDPEDGRLIAPQLHLLRFESLPGDVDLDQIGRRPIDGRDKRWIPLTCWSRRKQRAAPGCQQRQCRQQAGIPLQNVNQSMHLVQERAEGDFEMSLFPSISPQASGENLLAGRWVSPRIL